MPVARLQKKFQSKNLLDRLQLLAWLEAHGLPGGNGYLSTGARIAPDAGLSWAHVKHAEAAQFDAVTLGQRTFHAFKDGLDSHFSLGFRDASAVDHFVDDVELNHGRLFA